MTDDETYFVENLSYRYIVDESGYIVLAKDKDGRYIRVNSAAEKSLNMSLKDMKGKTDKELFKGIASTEVWREKDIKVMTTDTIDRDEDIVEILGANGQKFTQYYSTMRAALKDKSGKIVGMWGISHDITYLRERLNEMLTKESDRLKKLSESKSQFLSHVSHEMRTPLNGILGYADLLHDSSITEIQKDYLSGIQTCCTELLGMVNDVLSISELEQGQIQVNETDCNLYELLQSILSPLDKDHNVMLDVQNEFMYTTIRTDKDKLTQVLTNIIQNAVKFAKSKVTIAVKLVDTSIQIIVTDDGIGIESTKLDNIFEPFAYTSESLSRRKYGALRLSISKGLLNLMNGTIEIASKVDVETKVTIRIPYTPVQKRSSVKDHHESSQKKSLKVLVVDDNPTNLRIMVKTLQVLGHQAASAVDGKKAVELVKNQNFDLIFMDWFMPEMDGIETTKCIRNLDPPASNVVIIAVTANALSTAKSRVLEAGMNDYMTKPVYRSDLEKMIQKWST